jgi:hypothetical protein
MTINIKQGVYKYIFDESRYQMRYVGGIDEFPTGEDYLWYERGD